MAATIRLVCSHASSPSKLFNWANNINMSFRPPHATIDGQDTPLEWSTSTDIHVEPHQTHKLEVYFRVFDTFRMCGAELEIEPLQDGETRSYEYLVEIRDKYLNRGHLNRLA